MRGGVNSLVAYNIIIKAERSAVKDGKVDTTFPTGIVHYSRFKFVYMRT